MGQFKTKLRYGRGSGVKRFLRDFLFGYKKQKYGTVKELHKSIDANDKEQQELLYEAKKKIGNVKLTTFKEDLDLSTVRGATYDLERVYKDHWGRKRP